MLKIKDWKIDCHAKRNFTDNLFYRDILFENLQSQNFLTSSSILSTPHNLS